MEAKTTTEVKLTTEDISKILNEHFQKKHPNTSFSVRYSVGGHEDPSDWQAAQPLNYELDGATVYLEHKA